MYVEQLRLLAQLHRRTPPARTHAVDDHRRAHAAHEEHADERAKQEARGDADEDERGPAGRLEDGAEAGRARRAPWIRVRVRAWRRA